MNDREHITEQAIAWHVASESDDMDWDLFTVWLEADPRHRAAYDEVALSDRALADHAPRLRGEFAPQSVEAAPPRRRRWPFWGGAAIAASLVAVVAVPMLGRDDTRTFISQGTSQSIALRDGSRIELAPRSRLTLDGDESHIALQGGAYFDVRHDEGRQLSIQAGPVEISDIGTVFDVQSDSSTARVAVSEGQVEVRAPQFSGPVALTRSRALSFDARTGSTTLRDVEAGLVGEWRSGRLTYDNAPLGLVAQDLSRYAGATIAVPQDLADRRFSGTLAVGNGQAAITDLAQLMGLRLRRDAGGYELGR